MGVEITVNAPPATSSFNQFRIYRATSKAGSYSIIATQAVTDLTYYDEAGTATSWYKIDYYDSSTSTPSSLSEPLQGQATTYTTVRKVQAHLQLYTITDSTNPNVQQIVDLINRVEDEIDYRTGHAWRLRYSQTESGQEQTAQYESHDIVYPREYQAGKPVYLSHRRIRQLDATEGDALEYWNGSTYEDWIATRTEGRASDYWFDYDHGILYVNTSYIPRKAQAFRLKYRYGDTHVNKMVEDIATKMVAIEMLIGMDSRANIVADGTNIGMSHEMRVRKWQEDVDRKLQTLKEIRIPAISSM